MPSYRALITPLSAFGTPLKGDTLFGQLCWAICHRFGERYLVELLQGYTLGQPFLVASDAFPADHLPRPTLPGHLFAEVPGEDRKAVKKKIWMPLDKVTAPLSEWLKHCVSADAIPGAGTSEYPQPHNTLNRLTGTTGEGAFAPYAMSQLWHGQRIRSPQERFLEAKLDMYFVLDEGKLNANALKTLLEDIGALGYGRDASIGLGKFRLDSLQAVELPGQEDANAWLTLAPCAPQGLAWDAAHCFYNVFTRFGRHGDRGVLTGKPFKTPVLLADTGAVLAPAHYEPRLYVGQGLGGDGSLSKSIPGTVHQGYAPVVGVRLPDNLAVGAAAKEVSA